MVESLRADLSMVQAQLARLVDSQLSLTQKLDRVHALLQPGHGHVSRQSPQEEVPQHDDDHGAKDVPQAIPKADEMADGTMPELPIHGSGSMSNVADRGSIEKYATQRSATTTFNGKSANHLEKDKEKLSAIFLIAEQAQKELMSEAAHHLKGFGHSFVRHHLEMFDSKEKFVHWLDSWIGVIIFANAVFIGLSVDYEDPVEPEPAWIIVNVCFCVLFWIELILKLLINKPCQHFCGHDRGMNCFDAGLVMIDTFQLGLTLSNSDGMDGLPSASLFRIVRLLRLLRLVRLSRSDAAKDLVNMLTGLLGGIKTLMWSMGLFVITMYIAALIFHEALGATSNPEYEHIKKYFDTTPRSMFTVFRCSFGDCSDEGGTPIFEHINDNYGAFVTLLFCLFLFFVVVGLFNVISAIFVESTLSAAEKMQAEKKTARLQDEALFALEVSKLVAMLLDAQLRGEAERNPEEDTSLQHAHDSHLELSQRMEEVMALDLPCASINKMAKDDRFRAALNRLDIEPEDHRHLSSILDPDNSGKIDAVEFVSGVERLRGMPRRSDVVSVQLMIRSLQEKVEDLQEQLGSAQEETVARLSDLKNEVGCSSRHRRDAN